MKTCKNVLPRISKPMGHKIILAIALGLSMLAAVSAQAELDPAKEAQAQEIFGSVMSPYCVARSLRDCPSSAAHELQDQIREKIAAGVSSETIMQELLTTYGQKIRATPNASGFGLIGWLAPIGFAVLGIIILVSWLARRSDKAAVASAPQSLDPELEKRIKDELSRF